MSFTPPPDYWLEIPAGRYRVGLTPDEARLLAKQSAAWFKHKGIDLSPNEGKMIRQAAEMLDTTGNAAWVEQYLLAHYPAREIELDAFAIAKQPVTNAVYRQFMADTGETQTPRSWSRNAANARDDGPAAGLSWWQCVALAGWSGGRIPFEHEWERAVRGPGHDLFPWGNTHLPLGSTILTNYYPTTLPIETTRTTEGLEGALCGQDEWCADLWTLPPGLDPSEWGEESEPSWSRMQRGNTRTKVVACGVARGTTGVTSYGYSQDNVAMRLARGDGRAIPPPHIDTPVDDLVMGIAREFDSRVVLPVLRTLRDSPLDRFHVETRS